MRKLRWLLFGCSNCDIFEGAEYFVAGPDDADRQVIMRSRDWSVWRRHLAAEQIPGWGPWEWVPVGCLPRPHVRISKEEATRPPDGWSPPEDNRAREVPNTGFEESDRDDFEAWLSAIPTLGSAERGQKEEKMFDAELESFKTGIDLRAYAAAQGYQLDRKASWRGTTVMRHPVTNDKVIIKRGMDGHYVYFSVRDDRDNGSIIDWVQFRTGLSLGAVRKELRPWVGQPPVPVPSFPALHKTEKDRMKVEAAYAKMRDAVDGHPYLEGRRALPASLVASERFVGRIRIDDKGNAVFPHFDAEGLSGYELKNVEFTGFASGGTKALWLSNELPDDTRLVITESAIDALSHAVLFPDHHARYASIGGKPNPQQPELIRAAAARMPEGSEILAAMDADADGRKLAEIVQKAVARTGRTDLRFSVQEPEGAKDWNDLLRAKPLPFLPYGPKKEAVPQ